MTTERLCVHLFKQLDESHVLVYHYTSIKAAQIMMKFGIPAFVSSNCDQEGVVFSLKGPQTVKEGDAALGMILPSNFFFRLFNKIKIPPSHSWSSNVSAFCFS